MSPEAGPEPGWYTDPHGRHAHRWWDGTAWTDGVADAGRVATDPPGPATAPSTAGGGRRPSVGVLAVVAVLVVAVAALVIALTVGRDDDGSTPSDAVADEGQATDDPLEIEGAIDDDRPAAVAGFDLDAGDAVRIVVVSDGFDATAQLAVEPGAFTDGFRSLLAPGGAGDQVEERLARQAAVLVSNVSDGVDDEEIDDEDLDAMTDLLGDRVEGYDDAGYVFLGTDRVGADEPEGLQFVAPVGGRYALVVSGYGGAQGEFEATVEVVGHDDTGADDEIDYLDYLALYAEHLDAFCDEDFYGGDPDDVTNYGPTLCDPDTLQGVLAGEFNGDFTNDFGGGEGG